MNVLSLFDGISAGQIALNRAGIKVDNYYASEIDKYAIKVTQHNYPCTIQIGDVTKVSYKDGVLYTESGEFNIGKVDILLAGSPCQGFSLAGKQLAFNDERSRLYFEFERILKEVNPNYFILENVKMKPEYRDIISERLGVIPIMINSSLLSAQNRPRYYWTNIAGIEQPKNKNIKLQNIIEDQVDNKYYIKNGRAEWLKKFGEIKENGGWIAFNPVKAKCLTVRGEPSWNTTYIVQWPRGANPGGIRSKDGVSPSITTSSWQHNNLLIDKGFVRRLTPRECERLQTIDDDYTSIVSDSQRYKCIGNSWTVNIIVHILNHIKG